MNKWITLIIALSACTNPLKIKKERQISKQQMQEQLALNKSQVQQRALQDSNSFELLLHPIDSFIFNSHEGFKGKATQIYWRGTQFHKTLENDSLYFSKISSTKTKSELASKHNKKEGSRKIKLWLSITGILLLAFLLYRAKKYLTI